MKATLIKNVILILGITIVSELISAQSNTLCYNKCLTPAPDNAPGWCVPLLKCKIIADVRDILHRVPKHYQTYILNSKCDDGPTGEQFCCILTHIEKNFADENLSNTSCSSTVRIEETNETTNTPTPTITPISTFTQINTNSDENTNTNGDITINRILVDDIQNSIDPSFHSNLNLLPIKCGDGDSESDKVSNGEDAVLGEFPFMALLNYRFKNGTNAFLCSGSLINSRYILTAAHCVTEDLLNVRLGEHDTGATSDCPEPDDYGTIICNDPVQDIPIEEIIIHKNYIARKANNDIALIRLQRPADISANNVKVICLPRTAAQRDLIVNSAQIAGWGNTEQQMLSKILQKGVVHFNRDRQKCIDSYLQSRIRITDKTICATGDKKVDTCTGDSGGPLFIKIKLDTALTMKFMQLGIVSAGPSIACGDVNEHGGSLYTNVPKYMSWILNNIRE